MHDAANELQNQAIGSDVLRLVTEKVSVEYEVLETERKTT